MKTVISLLVLAGLASCNTHRQPKSVQESRLDSLDNTFADMYDRMWEERYDLPDGFIDTFELGLEEALRDPATFAYPFDSLRKANLKIVESDDHRIRIYWWLDPGSGTWRSYPAIFQLKVDSGLTVQNARALCGEEGFPDDAYQALYHLQDSLYLVWSGGSFSSMMPHERAFGYILSDTGLRYADNLFMDPEGDTLDNAIHVDRLWYLENMEKFNNTVPLVMQYDAAARTLSWPAMRNAKTGEPMNNNVWSDRDIEPSGDTFRLRFNGRYFDKLTP